MISDLPQKLANGIVVFMNSEQNSIKGFLMLFLNRIELSMAHLVSIYGRRRGNPLLNCRGYGIKEIINGTMYPGHANLPLCVSFLDSFKF